MRLSCGIGVVGVVLALGLAACGRQQLVHIVEIDVEVDSVFPDDVPLNGDSPEGDDVRCDGADGGVADGGGCPAKNGDAVVLGGCTPLAPRHDEIVVPASVTLDDVVGAVELNHLGPDAFTVSLIDAFGASSTGRRAAAIVRGDDAEVVAAHNPGLVLYRVGEGGEIRAGDLLNAPGPSDDMTFRYLAGDVEVLEHHVVTARPERSLSVRHLTEYDCSCASTAGAAWIPSLFALLALAAARPPRRLSPSSWR